MIKNQLNKVQILFEKCVWWLIFAETLRNTAMKEEDIYKIYSGTSDEVIK